MNKKYAEQLREETHLNYNLIAEKYAITRLWPPQDVKKMGNFAKKGERILDAGCANGYFFETIKNKNIQYYGVDISEKLIKIAKEKYSKKGAIFKIADISNLPFPDNFFDKTYSISVIHNVPSKKIRLEHLKEIKRVLKPKGFLILRVWDFWRRIDGIKLILKYIFLKLTNQSELDFKDVFVPWKNQSGKIITQRYFHCFTKREIKKLVELSGLKIKKIWREGKNKRSNIYLIAQK